MDYQPIIPDKEISQFCHALTVRQELAARFMAAIISREGGTVDASQKVISKEAFELADSFIDENNNGEST